MFDLNPQEIQYVFHNERDIEIPILLGTLQRNLHEIHSLLDVIKLIKYKN